MTIWNSASPEMALRDSQATLVLLPDLFALALLKKFCTKGSDEQDGIAKMFHLFQSAVFPLGMVRVSQPGHVTELDSDIVPFDYTIYTSIMCSESLRFYWTSYENQQIQYVDLNHLLSCTQPKQFDFQRTPQFICRS